ncbi:hypothetical protein ACLI4Z_14765 [Natrialbaceae archaeon A-arb3/5]
MTDSDENEARTRSDGEATAEENGIEARYEETEAERIIAFDRHGDPAGREHPGARESAVIAQNLEGYAILKVRLTVDGDELERYYGFDMALDHVAELLGVSPYELPIPQAAEDMGM